MYKHEISIANSAKIQKQIVSMYSTELSNIQDNTTRVTLANILFNRDQSEVNALRIAYHLATVKDTQAQAEGYKNATQMIMDVTGLKKSMISNYVRVARGFLMDNHGDFLMPDCVKGFTITQLVEGMDRVGCARMLEDMEMGNITADMSAKKIREYYKESEAIDTEATVTDADTEETQETANTEGDGTVPKPASPVYELLKNGEVVALITIKPDFLEEFKDIETAIKALTVGKRVD